MCNPAIALVAVTVASTAASMYSQSKQAKYQSAIADGMLKLLKLRHRIQSIVGILKQISGVVKCVNAQALRRLLWGLPVRN